MWINTFLLEYMPSHRMNKWKITIPVSARIPAAVMETAGHVRNITAKTVREQIAVKVILPKRLKKAVSKTINSKLLFYFEPRDFLH